MNITNLVLMKNQAVTKTIQMFPPFYLLTFRVDAGRRPSDRRLNRIGGGRAVSAGTFE